MGASGLKQGFGTFGNSFGSIWNTLLDGESLRKSIDV